MEQQANQKQIATIIKDYERVSEKRYENITGT